MRRAFSAVAAVAAGLTAACGGGVGVGPASTPTIGPCDTYLGPQYCSPVLCGNDYRNSCGTTPPGSEFCGDTPISEPCDGPDLGGNTCEAMGFASGTLRCLPKCDGFDTSGCGACLTTSTSVVRCGPPVPSMPVFPMAADIAATDTGVAMAWLVPTADDAGLADQLWLARLTPELDLVGAARLDEPDVDAARAAGAPGGRVAIAPLPSGWAVAGWTHAGNFLHAIDADGRNVGRLALPGGTELGNSNGVRDVEPPLLAARPGGGPLMVWGVGAGVYRAAVVSDDGRSTTAPVDIAVPADAYYQLMSATFAGDVFYVVIMFDMGIRVARISAAGDLVAVDAALSDITVFYPFFVDGADPPRIIYSAFTTASTPPDVVAPYLGSVLIAQDLGTGGAPPASPTYIRTGTDSYNVTSGVVFGGDTVLTVTGGDEFQVLSLARVDAGGVFVGDRVPVTRGVDINWSRVVRRGPDAVVAWFGFPAAMHIARVRP